MGQKLHLDIFENFAVIILLDTINDHLLKFKKEHTHSTEKHKHNDLPFYLHSKTSMPFHHE